MFPALLDWTRRARSAHPFPAGKVLEIGSRNVNGTPRGCFADAESYVGIDAIAGAGVDEVLQAALIDTRWPAGHFDTVLCYECLEHDPTFWLTLAMIRHVLRPGGVLIVTTPTFGFPLHRFPKDYFRFGEDAYREVIFAGCKLLALAEVRDSQGFPCLCGMGCREQSDKGTPT
jgi:SAM-dependent methyltransferase